MCSSLCKKKLIEATQLWLGSHNNNTTSLEDDLKLWGLTGEQSAPFLQLQSEPEFKLFPENVSAWNAFLTVSTQFIVHLSGISGLDYSRVESGLRMAGIEVNPMLFEKIRLIESEVINWSRSNGK